MAPREHTDKEYEHELRHLREQLLVMGSLVESLIGNSIKALIERDSELANRTIVADKKVDRMEVDLDGLCLQILARRQPVASDLRFITLVLKVVTDLERIADLAVNICERVVELGTEPQLKPYVDIPRMGHEVESMLREALDAFVAKDATRARAIIDRDETLDALYDQVFRELLTFMMEGAHNVYRATRLQSVAKYLERMADHTTNLAEMVIFMVDGQDVRHQGSRES
jgi:phosphate transport system protein